MATQHDIHDAGGHYVDAVEMNTLRDGFLAAMEELRRAALLTPEAVKAICEREGGSFDASTFIPNRDAAGIVVRIGRFVANLCHIDGVWRIGSILAVGQLEDAIAKAKGETNA